ncbi:MAG: glycosyltransferase family 4 protein, partial [Candidatus Hadarchaeum sp.]
GELVKVEPTWRFKLLRFWEETAIKKGRFFGCRTHFDSGYVKRLTPLAKVYDLPEAINPRFFEIIWEPIPRPNVLFVGSLVKRKGIEVLLEAFAMVRGKTPNARLTVVGEGAKEYKETLQIKAKNLGILSAVDFVGAKSADQIAQLHRESQMLILPSESENSPNSIAEALVSGLPVIATRVGGIPSMISDGETGFLVPPNDPRSLAEAILKLSSSVALQLAISRRAINMARPRHWPATVAEVTVSAYKDILST